MENNDKKEPILSEASSQPNDEINQKEEIKKDAKIVEWTGLIEKQTEINGEVLKFLSKNKNKETQAQLLEFLNNGAQLNKFLMQQIKNRNIELQIPEIIEEIPEKAIHNDKLNKFKNMIATFKAKADPSVIFRNAQKPDWYEMGYKVGIVINKVEEKTKPFYEKVVLNLQTTSQKAGVLFSRIKSIPQEIQDVFFIIGEKRSVRNLQKKFSKTLSELGLNAKNILHSEENPIFPNKDELKNKINARLETRHGIVAQGQNYQLEILNGLNDELKLEMIKSIMWPKLKQDLQENWAMTMNIQESIQNNKYINIAARFAEDNELNKDLVIHSLKKNPQILEGYIGAEKLLKNKDEIIKNADKYETFVQNTLININSIVKVVDTIESTIQNLNVSVEVKGALIKNIHETSVFIDKKSNISITYAQAKNNVLAIEKEKSFEQNIQEQQNIIAP